MHQEGNGEDYCEIQPVKTYINIYVYINKVMSKKYIYACIRIPMEVLPDGKYEPCPEYVKIAFERCDELPSIDPLENNNLMAVLSSFVPANATEPVVQELIPNRNTKYNTTFKQRHRNTNRYSIKNRKTISLKIEDGLLNSLTPVRGESGQGDHTYPNSSSA